MAELKRDCERNVAIACTFYEWTLEDGPNGLPFARKACELGDPEACWHVSWKVVWEKASGPDLREAAIRTHRESCKAGIPVDCTRLDSLLGRPEDTAGYHDLLLRECLALDLMVCAWAEVMIRNREAYIAVAELLCKIDIDEEECQARRSIVAMGNEVIAINPKLAASEYSRICVEGKDAFKKPYESSKRARDCVLGAKLYVSKEWPGGPDPGRADALLTQACELDLKALSRQDRDVVQKHCAGLPKSP